MNTKMLCCLCKQTMDDDRMVLSTCGHACCTHCAQQQCATRLALRMAKRGVLAQLDPAAIPATCTVCGMKSPLVTDIDIDTIRRCSSLPFWSVNLRAFFKGFL